MRKGKYRFVLSQVRKSGPGAPGYHDSNVHGEKARSEVIRYIHRNPVKRGLVEKPEDWPWSSFRHYAAGQIGVVEIESQWTAFRRGNQLPEHLRYAEKAG
jgi:putative transposase